MSQHFVGTTIIEWSLNSVKTHPGTPGRNHSGNQDASFRRRVAYGQSNLPPHSLPPLTTLSVTPGSHDWIFSGLPCLWFRKSSVINRVPFFIACTTPGPWRCSACGWESATKLYILKDLTCDNLRF